MTNPAEKTLGGWLVHVLREADSALSLEEALHAILDSMKVYFPTQSVALVSIDEDTNEARIKMSRQVSYTFAKEFRRKAPGPRIESLLLSQEPLLVVGAPRDGELYAEIKLEHDFTSAVLAPVIKGHRSVGYIFCDRGSEAEFNESDLLHLQVIGLLIGNLMVKFELVQERKQLSSKDDATGTLKYSAFVSALGRELKRAETHDYPVVLGLLCLPSFRNFLDMYGIDKAHERLALLARIIERHTREMDFLSRYSADRLVLCLSGLTEPEARKVLEAVREEAQREIGMGSGIAVVIPSGALILGSVAAKKRPLQSIMGSLGKLLVEAGACGTGGLHLETI
jgi:diguanylate cyclase (GGDEF)-like protein